MKEVKKIIVITPVFNETLGMIQYLTNQMSKVQEKLNEKGIGLQHFFLSDAATELPANSPVLVHHEKNVGLATNLVDGYRAVLALGNQPDIIVRMDCNEHNPWDILRIAENFSHSDVSAMFLPIWYWVKETPRPRETEVTGMLADFVRGLSPLNEEVILGTYNQKFPIGYQAFTSEFLAQIFPSLEKGLVVFSEITSKPASWGLDLLAIMLAGNDALQEVDFHFSGFATPWLENINEAKTAAQRDKAKKMVQVFRHLLDDAKKERDEQRRVDMEDAYTASQDADDQRSINRSPFRR